jgi:hypothetical protein
MFILFPLFELCNKRLLVESLFIFTFFVWQIVYLPVVQANFGL